MDGNHIEPPKNHGESPPFHQLIIGFFDPLVDRWEELRSSSNLSPSELKVKKVNEFINRWRKNVGDDIYPAFRLILPENDRERGAYGMKEKVLGKLLVKVLNISNDSPDAQALLNWKQGRGKSAGDFSERCLEAVQKRKQHSEYGTLTIAQVNSMLDELATYNKTEDLAEVIQRFYDNMNSKELKWVFRIIIRNMRIGVSEKTLLACWHPDAPARFNVTSNLKTVCWELYDVSYRLSQVDVSVLSCFQPQLATFFKSYDRAVSVMPENEGFFIEEKMDGERIQLHINNYGKETKFFSRRGNDYTSSYGSSYDDESGMIARYLKQAINPNVENCILDGEMLAWDDEEGVVLPFGSLKSALKEHKSVMPLFEAFDILYLNNTSLTGYNLKERRKALDKIITPVSHHIEVLNYVIGTKEQDISEGLRKAVEQSSEGLVIKNPLSAYSVNERNNDWVKIKPEYLEEFEETVDVCIVGGYYGTGKRARNVSSFLCGLRADDDSANPMRFLSFCRVGGGMSADEYANIRHNIGDKFQLFDPKNPPSNYLVLSGATSSFAKRDRPDVWIRPDESLVLEVKASQVIPSTVFKTGLTLRFPRFKQIRTDKNWQSALSMSEFERLSEDLEAKIAHKNEERKQKKRKNNASSQLISKRRRLLGEATNEDTKNITVKSSLFKQKTFFIMTDSYDYKNKMDKKDLQKLVKEYGGAITQTHKSGPDTDMYLIADKDIGNAASLKRSGNYDIVKPSWIFECILREKIVDFEPRFFLFATWAALNKATKNVDKYGDSYKRTIEMDELKEVLNTIDSKGFSYVYDDNDFLKMKLELNFDEEIPALLLIGKNIYMDRPSLSRYNDLGNYSNANYNFIENDFNLIQNIAEFCSAEISKSIHNDSINLIVVNKNDTSRLSTIRKIVANKPKAVRVVSSSFIFDCWKEGTLLAEERFPITDH